MLPFFKIGGSHHDAVLEVERRRRADADRHQVFPRHPGVREQGFSRGNHRGKDIVGFAFLVRDTGGRDERAVAEDKRDGHFRAADVEAENREWSCHVLDLLPKK